MSDEKCFGCGVRLNVGALLRYQNGAVEAIQKLYAGSGGN
jgi:hypothetical protein